MRLTTALVGLALIVPCAAPGQGSRADRPFTVAPAVLHQGGDYTVAARFGALAGSRRHQVARAFPSSRYWRAEGKGTLALDADLNPDPIQLDLAAGIAVSLAKPRVIVFNPADVDAPGSAMEFDYGTLSLAALGHVVTNQRRSEARMALGAELVYTHDHQSGGWPLVPGVYATVGFARPIVSDLRDSLGVPEDDSYTRLELGAAWHVSADRAWLPSALRPIWLHAEVTGYRDEGVDAAVEALRVEDGTRVALGVAYRFLSAERGLIDELFVRWTDGETPTLPAPRRAWMLGVVVAPR